MAEDIEFDKAPGGLETDDIIIIYFQGLGYDGTLPSQERCDDICESICDLFGFFSYDLEYNYSKVTFQVSEV
jgi:hypothetical protein